MFIIDIDGQHAFYQGDEDATAHGIKIDLQVGDAGQLTMTIPRTNPVWGKVTTRKSIVRAMRDGTEVFCGEVRKLGRNIYGDTEVTAYGEMAWLEDSIQPQAEFHNMSPRALLAAMVKVHNAQCPEHTFTVGTVTVTDSNDSLYRYTNRETTLAAIREKLVDRLGGYLRVRKANGIRYLDYLTIDTYGSTSTQEVRFGENIVDYSDGMTVDDVCSAVVPLGARLENSPDNSQIGNLEQRLTVKSVNGGRDYVINEDLVSRFGNVRSVKVWDDVTVAANLLAKAKSWLKSDQYEKLHITVRAIDLSLTSKAFGELVLGDKVRVVCPHLGLDKYFPIMRRTYEPDDPSNEVLELGSDVKVSYIAARAKAQREAAAAASDEQHHQSSWLQESIENVTAMLTGSRGGYKLTDYDSQGRWLADYYLDAPTKEQAKYVHKVTVDGDGYSTHGVKGPYETAIMADGTILGKFIKAHSVTTEQIAVDYTTSWQNADSKVLTTARTEFKAADAQITARVSAVEIDAKGIRTDLSAEIKVRADQISQTVKRGQISSTIEQTAETIYIKSNKFGWSSSNSSLTTDGTLTAKNATLTNCTVTGIMTTTGSGAWAKYATRVSGGFVNFIYGSTITARIKTYKGTDGNGLIMEAGTFNGDVLRTGKSFWISSEGITYRQYSNGQAGRGRFYLGDGSLTAEATSGILLQEYVVWDGAVKHPGLGVNPDGSCCLGELSGAHFGIMDKGKQVSIESNGNIYLRTGSGGKVYLNGTPLDL